MKLIENKQKKNLAEKKYHSLKNKKILFVTEGGKKKGLGHIMRVSSFISFISVNKQNLLFINKENYKKNYMNILNIKKKYYISINEILLFLKNIEYKFDIIIIDIFLPNNNFLKKINNFCSKLLVFDDLRRKYSANCIYIRPQETFFQKIIYRNNKEYYEGLNYFIVHKDYIKYRNKKKNNKVVKSILICMGGITPPKRYLNFIEYLDKTLNINVIVNVILGFSLSKINIKFSSRIFFKSKLKNLSYIIYKSDLAFISAGFIKFETMFIGTPFFMISINSHQDLIAKKFKKVGYCNFLGNINNILKNKKKLSDKINLLINNASLRNSQYRKNKTLIDGKSFFRFKKIILK